jgi:DNA-binding MarR family transcriptional regulator
MVPTVTPRPSRLQKELQQTKPFRSPEQEGVIGIVRTADLIRRSVWRAIEPHGISPQQYNVLRILRGARPESLPTLSIAERMIERTPGITRLLDRLERKHLVKRERCPTDRRQVMCEITAKGLEILATLDGPVARAEDEALGRISAADLGALIRILDAVREHHE